MSFLWTPVRVASDTIDDFEDGDIAEYGGDTSTYSVQQSTVIEGSSTLTGSSGGDAITSTSGLDNYFPPGETARCRVRATQGLGRAQVLWGVPSVSGKSNLSAYAAAVSFGNDRLFIDKFNNGSATELSTTGVTISGNTTFIVEIEYGANGSHTVRLLDSNESQLATVAATDSTYTSDGIGYENADFGTGDTYFYDNYRLV